MWYWTYRDRVRSLILGEMKKYKIKKVMVTFIHQFRDHLLTKEEMETQCKVTDTTWNNDLSVKKSVNDDLDSLIEDIRRGKEPNGDDVWTYFTPKLNKKELELVERKDDNFMQTFMSGMNADVSKDRMEASESDSKFVRGFCRRTTFTIKNH